MAEKYFDGKAPAPGPEETLDRELRELASATVREAAEFMDQMNFAEGLAAVFRLVGRANKYIDETMPWQLAKDPAQRTRLGTVLYYLLEVVRASALLLSPALPLVPGKVWAQIGVDPEKNKSWDDLKWGGVQPGADVRKGENLFPRIELSSLEGEPDVF
jgi:methionyl-tRNA synthetase